MTLFRRSAAFVVAALFLPFGITSVAASKVDGGVVVAVLDTGISPHPDLGWSVDRRGAGRAAGIVLPGYDFVSNPWTAADGDGWDSDPTDMGDGVRAAEVAERPECRPRVSSWHGTNVAGTIKKTVADAAGTSESHDGVLILPVRILGRCGGNTADVAAGILWAAGHSVPGVPMNPNPAKILNVSLSGKSATCPNTLQTAIDVATRRGALVVVAAGSTAANTKGLTPANCKNVIVVGAIDQHDRRSPTSSFGREVTLSAFGGNMALGESSGVYTTTNKGLYRPRKPGFGYYQGSSAAAAHVSAALAVLAANDPESSAIDLQRQLLTPPLLSPFAPGQCDRGDSLCGAGILRLNQLPWPRTTTWLASR
jgi:serine protease